MNDKCGKDLAVSIRDRLLNLARERGEDFQLILTQYGKPTGWVCIQSYNSVYGCLTRCDGIFSDLVHTVA